jgi:eukaryotic-like serine/threonine-protein kinase
MKDRLKGSLAYLGHTLTNPYMWMGLGLLAVMGVLIYIVVAFVVMPTYTKHDEFVLVPDVRNYITVDATDNLERRGLRAEVVPQRYNPNVPQDAVIDQSPAPGSHVKPGRRVYLTVNAGEQVMIRVPRLTDLSVREATSRLTALGLRAGEVRPDTIPSPYANTITRQEPQPGDSLAQGSTVRLWYSTGLGTSYVTMPDVTGLNVEEAERILIEHRLRYVVIGAEEDDMTAMIERQSREPGTRVREGFEIRLFVGDEADRPEPPAQPDLDI